MRLLVLILTSALLAQTTPQTRSAPEDFNKQMAQMRDMWVKEFNAGHAEAVAKFYSPDAMLMRWDGTVHGYDSILAEFQRSISGGAHDYVVHTLRTERSGELAYDTGAYNVTLRTRVVEGNYLVVAKRIGGQWKIVAHASVANPQTRP